MRKEKRFFPALIALAATLCALAGCGSADDPNAGGGSGGGKTHRLHKATSAKPGQNDLADMVAAVSATKSGPAVDVRFNLPSKPEVGQPLSIAVAIVARSPSFDSMAVAFQAPEGIQLVAGAQTGILAKPAEGDPVRHELKIIPQHDGIYLVTAIVTVTTANESSSRTYAIPVIAGPGSGSLAKTGATKGT